MDILTALLRGAARELESYEESLRIDNVILGKSYYSMYGSEAVFTDMNLCLVLLENAYGFAYFQEPVDYSHAAIVNMGVQEAFKRSPNYMQVALVDALYCVLRNVRALTPTGTFAGTIRAKAIARAKCLAAIVEPGSKVLLLGVASEIVEELVSRGCNVVVLDLETQKVGMTISGLEVKRSDVVTMREEIAGAEYVIATGMMFVTQTADDVFGLAHKYGAKLVLYMQTGANFGPALIDFGAFAVLSEHSPFYDLYGETSYTVSKAQSTIPRVIAR